MAGTVSAEESKRIFSGEQARQQKANFDAQVTPYMDKTPVGSEMRFFGDPTLLGGQMTGLDRARNLYGMTVPEIGSETQGILARRRARLDGYSPSGTRLRESRNRRVRMARAGGRSAGEQESIKRQSEKDIADVDYAREGQALTDYQRLVGKILGGTQQLEMGYTGLAQSGQYTPPPQMGGGLLGTVICTELFKQGYMDSVTYNLDIAYGIELRRTRPHVYTGYRTLAGPVVRLMQKSKVFTKIISVPALAWADNMAGRSNILGKLISIVGEALCGFVGKLGGEYGKTSAY